VHCNVIIDVDTGQTWSYKPNEIAESLKKLEEADMLIGQNIIGYDLVVLNQLYNWTFKGKVMDTLVMSRLSNTNRPLHPNCPTTVWDEHNQKNKMIGPHTLMNLGYYAGVIKGDFGQDAGWEVYSDAMLEYCKQDVVVNVSIYFMLLKELLGFSSYSIELEMDIAFYMQQQQANGWVFDYKKAIELECDMAERIFKLEQEVQETFKPLSKAIKTIQPRVKISGSLSSVGLKFLGDFESLIPPPDNKMGDFGIEYLSGEFTRIDWPEFNLGSRQQIAEQLIHRGWKPKERTEKGSIIINESVLETIKDTYPEAQLLADYFLITKRQSMVASWVEAYNDDTGRIHGYVNSLGAVTGRMTHSKPNLAQVPSSKTDKEGNLLYGFEGGYGADCRSLFIVPEGMMLLGCDASGLELRCLAHYMNDSAYTDVVLNGDIHTVNQLSAGLPTRNMAKTFIYGYLYGAGDSKIGEIVGGTAKHGKALKKKFLANTPALKILRERVLQAAERGWLLGIDGRRVRVRSPHAALNTLLQSCGAIIMKVFLRQFVDRSKHLDYELIGNVHDEIAVSMHPKDKEEFTTICLDSMIAAGEELNMRCKIEGDVMVGPSWDKTH
jgi:DNA polymerase I-like protein with 3'-5' exonuclease and polymerase domains